VSVILKWALGEHPQDLSVSGIRLNDRLFLLAMMNTREGTGQYFAVAVCLYK
jgi:hypothetical protein